MTCIKRAPMIPPMTDQSATDMMSSSEKPSRAPYLTASVMPARTPTAVKKPCQVISSGPTCSRVGSMFISIMRARDSSIRGPTSLVQRPRSNRQRPDWTRDLGPGLSPVYWFLKSVGACAMNKTVAVETNAQAYLELLRDRGVDYFFGNGGTDFAPIVDAFARFVADGKTTPRPMTVPHEFVAASMAHGYYLVTGRPQVVMVHVTVGTANLSGAIINASRAQVPIIFSAGRTPISERGSLASRDTHIHW